MPKILKTVLRVALFLFALLVVIAFFSRRLIDKSLPALAGTQGVAGLRHPVTVYRDGYGVPHLFAQNEEDLWRAAGYVTAQDRLWQMDLTRRTVRGTLAEIFGPEALPKDKFLRTWGFHHIARRLTQHISPQSRAALTAYAAGVNDFINSHRDRLPVEFSILGYKPQPWEIEDSIGLTRLMAFQLCYAWFCEAALGKIAEEFGDSLALELFPAVRENTPAILPASPGLATRVADFLELAQATRNQPGMPAGVLGSNSWVVGPQRSRSGKPILANDPHLGLALPSVWYEMHLSAGDFDVAGVTFPGAPGIVLGNNRAIAWGFTNGMVDDLDFYFEKLNPQNPEEYWNGQAWEKLIIRRERIPVKDADSVDFVVRATPRGPLVSEILSVVRFDTLALAIRWSGFENSDELRTILGFNRARSWSEFQAAARHFAAPCQNVVYADTAGNIGYWACGAVPIRRDGRGYLPYRGWEKAGDWIGTIPFEQMPHAFNPPQHFLATANNRMQDRNYPYYLSVGWEPSSRIERITELLEQHAQVDTAVFADMQQDQFSKHAQYVLPRLLALLADTAAGDSGGGFDAAPTGLEQNALLLLREWDYVERVESVAAAIFNVWSLEFLRATLRDELGDSLFQSYTQWSNLAVRSLEHFVSHPASPWFDDRRTERRETAREIARQSLHTALAFLEKHFGGIIGDWEWGRLHQLTLAHVFGQRRPLDYLFNVGPIPIGGSANTISKAEYHLSKPYAAVIGPSVRMIVDMAAPQVRLQVLPGGASGQPRSPHYQDQVKLWQQGRYKRILLDRTRLAQECRNVLVLQPAAADR
ncbi:MAG: penicillin acylase family protein [candidate division KSB1 bacterium]|nr:penicillin acylase family protein [candidate division KSB1 bacterium]MDZ7274868.1 penicillin acylase family protein [candidate division KSB1 bacterium]MDZ7286680.1 penicillin acylase family protein [candidate division KSB1 bacterium]MDZ7299157.1 penicillin acylase family protein [candidate division KSB1 bacterium]MDZ7307033.1 penicillin acylase family protein [candidate division KSB1 bacterium]